MPSVPPIKVPIVGEDRTSRAIRSAEGNINRLGRTAKATLGALGVGLGISGISRLTNQVIQYGSALTDAAAATRLGVEEYQVLKFAAQEAGAGMDKITTALAKTQKATNDAINGLTTYTRAFDALGIDVKEFQRLSPERQMETLGRSMVNSGDQATAYASVLDLIGSRNAPRLMEVLRRLGTEGFAAVEQAARDAGQVMDEYYAQRLDEAADAMERFKTRMTVVGGDIVTFWMDAADGMNPWEQKLNASAETILNRLNPAVRAALEAEENYQAALSAGAGNKYLQYLKDISEAKLADAVASEAATEAQKELNTSQASESQSDRIAKLIRQISEVRGSAATNVAVLESEISDLQAQMADFNARGLEGTEEWAVAYISALEKAIKLESLRRAEIEKSGKARADALKMLEDMSAQGNTSLDDVFAAMDDAEGGERERVLKDWTDQNLTAHQMMVHSMQNMSDSMTDSFMDFIETGKVNFSDFVSSVLSDIARLTFQQSVANPLAQMLSGSIGSVFGGARAEGGNVDAGKTYLVGEKGPELRTFSRSGSIIPNHKLFPSAAGGGSSNGPVSVSVSVNIDTIDSASFAGRLNEFEPRLTAAAVAGVNKALNKRGRRGVNE